MSFQAMSATTDGSTIVLSAGLKLIVVRRLLDDWSKWEVILNLTSSIVFDNAILSGDGKMLAVTCESGICVYRYNTSSASYKRIYTVPPVEGLVIEKLALSTGSEPLLVVSFDDLVESEKWSVATFNFTSGKQVWRYMTPKSSGQYADAATSIAITPDGAYLSVGSFGDADNINPQLHVFKGWGGDGTPIISHVCAGSVGAVEILVQNNVLTTIALGLHQHENTGVTTGAIVAITQPI